MKLRERLTILSIPVMFALVGWAETYFGAGL